MLICIENKVFSNVHDNQLDRYYSYIENDLDNDFKYSPYWNRAYILLAPDGKGVKKSDAPKSYEHWKPLSYADIAIMMRSMMDDTDKGNGFSRFLIANYLDLLAHEHIIPIEYSMIDIESERERFETETDGQSREQAMIHELAELRAMNSSLKTENIELEQRIKRLKRKNRNSRSRIYDLEAKTGSKHRSVLHDGNHRNNKRNKH